MGVGEQLHGAQDRGSRRSPLCVGPSKRPWAAVARVPETGGRRGGQKKSGTDNTGPGRPCWDLDFSYESRGEAGASVPHIRQFSTK